MQRRHFLGVLAAAALTRAARPARATQVPVERPTPDIEITPLAPRVHLHTTYGTLPRWGRVGANGLLVETPGGVLLVDTGWSDAQADALCDWAARKLPLPVRAAVVTHAHEDRVGGVAALRRRGIAIHAERRTAAAMAARKLPAPDVIFDGSAPIRLGAAKGPVAAEVFFPGAGHAADNVVVWLAAPRVLFGGCLVKGGDATDLGNTSDADVKSWPGALERVRARYPAAQLLVPGHGRIGGSELLGHTGKLVQAYVRGLPH